MAWWVYMIECDDGSLYTGITTDIARRFREHSGGPRGSRYLRARQPLGVVYLEGGHDRSSALRREAAIKALKRSDKINLKQSYIDIALSSL